MKRPRLNALRTFEAAGRHLSFSVAGRELGVSQAAVSQQIRQLEGYLGARLFLRHNRRLELSSVGEAYHLAVNEALERLDSITDQLFPGGQDRTVTIKCSPSVAALWLSPNLGRLHALHPEIELRIMTVDAERNRTSADLADLEILILQPDAAGPGCRELFTARIAPVCAPSLLGDERLSAPSDVLRHDLVHVIGYRDDWHRWFRNAGLKVTSIRGGSSFDGSIAALEAVLKGGGIMLGRRPFIDPYLGSGELVAPFGDEHFLTERYFLRWRDNGRRRDVAAVAEWLLDLAGGA